MLTHCEVITYDHAYLKGGSLRPSTAVPAPHVLASIPLGLTQTPGASLHYLWPRQRTSSKYLVLVRQRISASTVVTQLITESFQETFLSISRSHSCGRNHHRSFPVVILLTHQARDALLAPCL